MQLEPSIWQYFFDAGFVVKTVMLILMFASIATWTIIFQRSIFFKKVQRHLSQFETRFWSGMNLTLLYRELDSQKTQKKGIASIFHAGFKEYLQIKRKTKDMCNDSVGVDRMQRMMWVASNREAERLETHLSFLASVGSISPYVGLLGTVWGIMTSFQALSGIQQATISMVAPGIAEALIATAMGLFAAIPAVLAYNRYSNTVTRLLNRYERFQEEFSNILYRQNLETKSQTNKL